MFTKENAKKFAKEIGREFAHTVIGMFNVKKAFREIFSPVINYMEDREYYRLTAVTPEEEEIDTSEQDAIEFDNWLKTYHYNRPANYQIPSLYKN